MLYIIGLGLNEKGITLEGVEAVKSCDKVYLEDYTVDFPYKLDRLIEIVGKEIVKLDRKEVESERVIKEAIRENIALLVYGCPLFATTHMSLLEEAIKQKVKYKVIYSFSIFDSLGETGLELYKFGKVSSLPKWQKNYEPDSFLDYIIDNKKIDAHSLLLSDIGLSIVDALDEIEKSMKKRNVKIDKIVVCTNVGNKDAKFYYGKITELKKLKIKNPFCFIIPGKLHFIEENSLKRFLIN